LNWKNGQGLFVKKCPLTFSQLEYHRAAVLYLKSEMKNSLPALSKRSASKGG
jgi:hypothetical protein